MVWISAAILLIVIAFWLKKRFPGVSIWNKAERVLQSREGRQVVFSDKKAHVSFREKIINVSFSDLYSAS